ncbi:MAG: PaaI family thioesterase [Vulcanimicrobiaceae bacterium]
MTNRTHELEWTDPAVAAARGMSGLEYLRAMRDGVLPQPPVSSLLELRFEECERGQFAFAGIPRPFFANPMGGVHGGVAASLLDSAMGCATLSSCDAGIVFTTLELHANFVRPLPFDCEVGARAQIVHAGNRIVTSQGRVEDRRGTLYAHGSSTCMLLAWPG